MAFKAKLGLTLFSLGLVGVLSLLTVDVPLENIPQQVLDRFTPRAIKLLILINPTLFMLIAVVVGTTLFDKVGLTVPAISSLLDSGETKLHFKEQVKYGVALGLITGVLITLVVLFSSLLHQKNLSESM